jgi:hypothetical protein
VSSEKIMSGVGKTLEALNFPQTLIMENKFNSLEK